MTLAIIKADERIAQKRGVKALITGPAGVGKTSLLRTLDTKSTLFVDLEAGDLAVQDVKVDTLRPQTWEECCDIAAFLGGPNPSLPADSYYSEAHYKAVLDKLGNPKELDKYETYFIDSITVSGRLCFRWAEQQPEAFSERGKKDLRGTYGLHGRAMVNWLTQIQHARGKNVIFVAILEKRVDDFNVAHHEIQIEGSKTGRELPGIVDQILTLQWVDFGDGNPLRAFVCTQPNPWDYPAKDRAGRLDQIEEPHLGKLLTKLTATGERKPFDPTLTKPATQAAA